MIEFKKYSKIKQIGHTDNVDIFKSPKDEIIIQEKVDGSNIRFYITKEGKIIFGSRNQQLTSNKGENTNVEKNFIRCIKHVNEMVFKDLEIKKIKKFSGYIFFGENMIKHTMNYDWEKIPPFLGFDIYNIKTGKYLEFNKVKEIYDTLNLEMVPLIKICKSKDIKKITDKDVPKSKYALISAEGIVFKNYSKQLMAKYVREKFKEKNKEVFGMGKKFTKTDDEYFVAVYCTNARIDKCIFKLLDEGKALGMEMMGTLLNMVYKDIWEENWQEISLSKKMIDLNKLKKLISKRCLNVLQQAMVNNSLK